MIATVSARGAARWTRGHPWIFKSDVVERPTGAPGVVRVRDDRGRMIGQALWSPTSQIALRLLDTNPDREIDAGWWRERIGAAVARRTHITDANSFRLIHAEGDLLPSLVCDRYDEWLVVQLGSAGLEGYRSEIVAALQDIVAAKGILARNDISSRSKEGLVEGVELVAGDVPREIEVVENGVRYLAAPWDGQKTGAFLDQRENRARMQTLARGRALDCFSYHGSFALHLARHADSVLALDISAPALARANENFARNGITNVETLEADAFEYLKAASRGRDRFDTIVVDPPAFAKNRSALGAAVRGYTEINLRAMRLLAPGGLLFTASCSFHLSRADFLAMLAAAAADAGRPLVLRGIYGQPSDHPELLSVPETGYLKGALIEALP